MNLKIQNDGKEGTFSNVLEMLLLYSDGSNINHILEYKNCSLLFFFSIINDNVTSNIPTTNYAWLIMLVVMHNLLVLLWYVRTCSICNKDTVKASVTGQVKKGRLFLRKSINIFWIN